MRAARDLPAYRWEDLLVWQAEDFVRAVHAPVTTPKLLEEG